MYRSRKKFFISTFGCRTNQADSAAIRQDFINGRYCETQRPSEADVIVVNSCTVTGRSDQQVRQSARRLRRENPRARIVLTGCYAQRAPEALARLPGVDLVVGNNRKQDLFDLVSSQHSAPTGGINLPSLRQLAAIYRDDFRKVRAIGPTPAAQTGGKTRPFVKIQDGCDSKCAYCIIPVVRGASRSVPPDQVLMQIRDLVARGFKEVVLTGIHIGTYGMHLQPRYGLNRLVEAIATLPGLRRVRISSIEPMELSRQIIDLAAQNETIAPHFHICLQSGSDRILRRMLRPYSTSRFAEIVESIRERIPNAGIGSDVIAGFPGETEEDHCQTLEFVERMPFTYLHVFPYSDRSGTRAADMPAKVPAAVIKRRSSEVRRLSEKKNRTFRRRFLGKRLSVLTLTEEENGMRSALSGNYLKAKVDRSIPPNQIVEGKVLSEDREALVLAGHGPDYYA